MIETISEDGYRSILLFKLDLVHVLLLKNINLGIVYMDDDDLYIHLWMYVSMHPAFNVFSRPVAHVSSFCGYCVVSKKKFI